MKQIVLIQAMMLVLLGCAGLPPTPAVAEPKEDDRLRDIGPAKMEGPRLVVAAKPIEQHAEAEGVWANMAGPRLVVAAGYELVAGKGVAVCEAYFNYIKTHTRHYPGTVLKCEREFPAGSALKRPAWQSLEREKNKLLVLRIENYLEIPRDEKATQPWVPVHPENDWAKFAVDKLARLHTAELDINNDGKPESVVKYQSGYCNDAYTPNYSPSWVGPLVIGDVATQTLNIEKTYPLMQNRYKEYITNVDEIEAGNRENSQRRQARQAEIRRREIAGESYSDLVKSIPRIHTTKIEAKFKPSIYAAGLAEVQSYDVFHFQDTAYFDKWDGLYDRWAANNDSYRSLTVYKTTQSKTDTVCRYQFHDQVYENSFTKPNGADLEVFLHEKGETKLMCGYEWHKGENHA